MPKQSKGKVGILGVKRKKQMLFSFTTREDWSDDSSDEDFVLSDDEETGSSKAKRSRKKRRIEQKADSAVERQKNESATSREQSCDKWGHGLPSEILTYIFELAVQDVGSIPLLLRVGRVNTTWHEVSLMPQLWSDLDLSYGWVKTNVKTLQWFADNRSQYLKHLNLNSWKKLLHKEFEVLIVKCQQLESITLSRCIKLQGNTMKLLVDSCPKLHTVDFSACHVDMVRHKTLDYLITNTRHQLRSLTLALNMMSNMRQVMAAIATCHELRLLDLSQCKDASSATLVCPFHIELLQSRLPKLRVLRMAGVSVSGLDIPGEEEGGERVDITCGFPDLRELSLASSAQHVSATLASAPALNRLLRTSTELTLLDLRASCCVDWTEMSELACQDVTELYLAQSQLRGSTNKDETIAAILKKWHHSLRILDLSSAYMGMGEELWEEGFRTLVEHPAPHLHTLVLTGTQISEKALAYAIRGCPALKSISTVSCRSLPRGYKDTYEGPRLQALRRKLSAT